MVVVVVVVCVWGVGRGEVGWGGMGWGGAEPDLARADDVEQETMRHSFIYSA